VSTDSPARQAEALGVRAAVVFAGPVPHEEIGAYLALADLEAHWLTQEAPERTSLGIASLEAMAAGKTVLSVANSNTYGRGVIRNGENAVLVQPNQPEALAEVILGLLEDKERCNRIGASAAETVRTHFSWDHVCAQTLDVYLQAKPLARLSS
jgi:phosphatidylinositol alpha-1,6-mannosyltransferase